MTGVVLHLLPMPPWTRAAVGVLCFVVLLGWFFVLAVKFYEWLPLRLIQGYANWQRFGKEVLHRRERGNAASNALAGVVCSWAVRPQPRREEDRMAGFLFTTELPDLRQRIETSEHLRFDH